jgi:hypothetical protein
MDGLRATEKQKKAPRKAIRYKTKLAPLDRSATEENKKIFLEALNDNLGLVLRASEQTSIHSVVHYLWMKSDPKYREAVEEMIELKRDFVEKKLIGLVEKDEPSCVTFTAKCLLRKRGYDQTVILANQEGEKFQVAISPAIVDTVLKTMYSEADNDQPANP